MEYIILDLEWDSIYFPPEKRFLNHILQIGAIRLDDKFNVIGTFSKNITSPFIKKVTKRFSALTGLTIADIRLGLDFKQAVDEYNAFSSGAQITMTWSNSDLYSIIENQEYIFKNKVQFTIDKYLDLQKLVQWELANRGYESKNQISLENAAELLGVETENYSLHTALDDCLLCGELLKICYNQSKFNSLIKDTSSPDFYARLKFKPYAISNINDSNIKSSQLEFTCPKCNKKVEKLKPWKYRNRWFITDFKCNKCNYKFSGRVMFKKTFDDLVVKQKVCEYRPKKETNNDLQSLPETVQN